MKPATRTAVAASLPVLLLLGLWSRPANADPILITRGALVMTGQTGTVTLEGSSRGFTLVSNVSTDEGRWDPWDQCWNPVCLPGTSIDLYGIWVGMGAIASGTVDGRTFTRIGTALSEESALLEFTGSVVAPPLDLETTSVMAPFLFRGRFGSPSGSADLAGQGMATLSLRQGFGPDENLPYAWKVMGARYEFTPTPEPATLALTAAGLAVLLRKRRGNWSSQTAWHSGLNASAFTR